MAAFLALGLDLDLVLSRGFLAFAFVTSFPGPPPICFPPNAARLSFCACPCSPYQTSSIDSSLWSPCRVSEESFDVLAVRTGVELAWLEALVACTGVKLRLIEALLPEGGPPLE